MASGDSGYALRLCEDTLPASGRGALPALNRVLYVRRGVLVVASAERAAQVVEDQAWHGAQACEAGAGADGATVLRWERSAARRRSVDRAPAPRRSSSSTRSASTRAPST